MIEIFFDDGHIAHQAAINDGGGNDDADDAEERMKISDFTIKMTDETEHFKNDTDEDRGTVNDDVHDS